MQQKNANQAIVHSRRALTQQRGDVVVTYDKAFRLVKSLEIEVRQLAPDVILGVMRSGAIPAMMLSQRIDVPVILCQCNRGDPQATFASPVACDLVGKRVLIVDDFVSTGSTLKKVRDLVRRHGGLPLAMALFYAEHAQDKPELGYLTANFVRFVWDKLEATPSSVLLFEQNGGAYAPDAVQEFYGFDLDGVFVPDLRRRWYSKSDRLEALLNLRDTLAPLPSAPQVLAQQSVIITARPDEDHSRTRTWLDAHGLAGVELICRDPERFAADTEGAAAHKAHIIRQLGVSTFYESDLSQALSIAQACPVVDVIWWSKGRPLRVTADSVGAHSQSQTRRPAKV